MVLKSPTLNLFLLHKDPIKLLKNYIKIVKIKLEKNQVKHEN